MAVDALTTMDPAGLKAIGAGLAVGLAGIGSVGFLFCFLLYTLHITACAKPLAAAVEQDKLTFLIGKRFLQMAGNKADHFYIQAVQYLRSIEDDGRH